MYHDMYHDVYHGMYHCVSSMYHSLWYVQTNKIKRTDKEDHYPRPPSGPVIRITLPWYKPARWPAYHTAVIQTMPRYEIPTLKWSSLSVQNCITMYQSLIQPPRQSDRIMHVSELYHNPCITVRIMIMIRTDKEDNLYRQSRPSPLPGPRCGAVAEHGPEK